MRILVTAGNTQTPIDRVRCITNIFTGRTGAAIAREAYRRGHHVTLATSHPDTADGDHLDANRWRRRIFHTFADLDTLLAQHLAGEPTDAIVQCAAISDFLVAGAYSPAVGCTFERAQNQWQGNLQMQDRVAGKIPSDEPELWLRLVKAPKLIDKIRTDWSFRGLLVKFKLQVGMSDEQLLAVAESSRRHSTADWMVANTLESIAEWAYLGNERGYNKIARSELPGALLEALETSRRGGGHG